MRSKRNFFIFFTIFLFASVVIYLASQFRELPPNFTKGAATINFSYYMCSSYYFIGIHIMYEK